MACRMSGTKALPEPVLQNCQLDISKQTLVKFELKYKTFHTWQCVWNCRWRNAGLFVKAGGGGDELIIRIFMWADVTPKNWLVTAIPLRLTLLVLTCTNKSVTNNLWLPCSNGINFSNIYSRHPIGRWQPRTRGSRWDLPWQPVGQGMWHVVFVGSIGCLQAAGIRQWFPNAGLWWRQWYYLDRRCFLQVRNRIHQGSLYSHELTWI